VKNKLFIFIIQNNNKNRIHIKIKNKKIKVSREKLKHEPSLKKPGDFTVPEGHGYPLYIIF
jgi:neutral trehalase